MTDACNLLGDVNFIGQLNLRDINPFVELLVNGSSQLEADIHLDRLVNLLDVDPFVQLLAGH